MVAPHEIPYIPVFGNHDEWPYVGQGSNYIEYPRSEVVIGGFFYNAFKSQFDSLRAKLPNWQESPLLSTPTDDFGHPDYGLSHFFNYAFDYLKYRFIITDFNTRDKAWVGGGTMGYGETAKNEPYNYTWTWLRDNISDVHKMIIFNHQPYCEHGNPGPLRTFTRSQMREIADAGLLNNRPIARVIGGHVHDEWPDWVIYDGSSHNSDTICYSYRVNAAKDGYLYLFPIKDSVQLEITYYPNENPLPTNVKFSCSFNYVGNQNIPSTYYWDFGDGQSAYTSYDTITHFYNPPSNERQTYKVNLIVTTASGRNVSIAKRIRVKKRVYDPPSMIGFEGSSHRPYENWILYSQGVSNCSAYVADEEDEGIPAYDDDKYYKITGYDYNSGQLYGDYAAFKLFDCNFQITNQTFLSFWIYVRQAPNNLGRIVLEGKTASGQNLRGWTKYGIIIDQNGREIHPAGRNTPEGQWVFCLFNLCPAQGEVLTELFLTYDDLHSYEDGWFTAYIDEMRIRDGIPPLLPDAYRYIWFPEVFGNGPPGDPNFILGLDSLDYWGNRCGSGERIIVNGRGNSGEGDFWIMPPPSIRRRSLPAKPITQATCARWNQWDKAHALHLWFLVQDATNTQRWLVYAKNAWNWWDEQGWVDMGERVDHYNIWETFSRNIYNDFWAEYNVCPNLVSEIRLGHFCKTTWEDDSGGVVTNIGIFEDPLQQRVVGYDRATHPNTGELLSVDSKSGNLHMVYNADSKFYYVSSDDKGDTWSLLMQVDSATRPSITLDTLGMPRITYLKNDTVFCQILKPDSTWDTIVIFGANESWKPKQPAVASSYPPELADYSYCAFSSNEPTGINSNVNLSIFNVTEDTAPPPNEVASGENQNWTSIAITPGDYVHLVWEENGEIFYRTTLQTITPGNEIEWSKIYNISESPMVISEHPVVEAYGENIIVAWKEGNPGEIFRTTRKMPSDSIIWSAIENISKSPNNESDYPVLSTQDVVAWQEQVGLINYEIYVWIQGDIVNLSETENSSKYPHIAVEPQELNGDSINPKIVIDAIWTEAVIGDSLYEVRFKRYEHTQKDKGSSGMIEYISVSVGDSLPSPYCQQRDGYIHYGEYKLDFSRSSLIYNLPYLKPKSAYLLKALVYQAERGRWREKMYVDTTLAADVYYDPKIPKMVNIILPNASYGSDLEIMKEIRKVLGRVAVVADLKIFEVKLPDSAIGKEGILGTRTDIRRYALYQNRPNPFKDITKISFVLPKECKVSLFIYDVSGRKVRTLVDGKLKPGNYNLNWDGRDNRNRRLAQGIYFYRFQTEDFKDTKKTILLK